MRKPSPADGKSCWKQKSNGIGSVNPEAADRESKKNTPPLEDPRRSAPRPYCRRSHWPTPFVDEQTTGANHRRTAAGGYRSESADRTTLARTTRLCLARQLQIALHCAPATGSAVSMYRPPENPLSAPLSTDYQCGHEKERTGRQLQKSRPGLEPGSDRRPGSRLSL